MFILLWFVVVVSFGCCCGSRKLLVPSVQYSWSTIFAKDWVLFSPTSLLCLGSLWAPPVCTRGFPSSSLVRLGIARPTTDNDHDDFGPRRPINALAAHDDSGTDFGRTAGDDHDPRRPRPATTARATRAAQRAHNARREPHHVVSATRTSVCLIHDPPTLLGTCAGAPGRPSPTTTADDDDGYDAPNNFNVAGVRAVNVVNITSTNATTAKTTTIRCPCAAGLSPALARLRITGSLRRRVLRWRWERADDSPVPVEHALPHVLLGFGLCCPRPQSACRFAQCVPLRRFGCDRTGRVLPSPASRLLHRKRVAPRVADLCCPQGRWRHRR